MSRARGVRYALIFGLCALGVLIGHACSLVFPGDLAYNLLNPILIGGAVLGWTPVLLCAWYAIIAHMRRVPCWSRPLSWVTFCWGAGMPAFLVMHGLLYYPSSPAFSLRDIFLDLVLFWGPPLGIGALGIHLAPHRARYRPGFCQECGYDLTGNVSGICPECGSPLPEGDEGPGTGPRDQAT